MARPLRLSIMRRMRVAAVTTDGAIILTYYTLILLFNSSFFTCFCL